MRPRLRPACLLLALLAAPACGEDGRVVFDLGRIPFADRATLDEQARALAAAMAPVPSPP
jgi:hypothetical protein